MNNTLIKRHWSIVIILVLTPVLLFASLQILPTFDDWVSLTSPSFQPLFTKERWLFYGYHWRPFDSVIGYILGLHPRLLFPSLNHVIIIVGHLLCTLLIFKTTSELGFQKISFNIATLFFFITPASMATVLAVDSMNQIYALIWGLMAFLVYIKVNKRKYLIWGLFIFIATLCKENGIMWALICPILAFGFDIINEKKLKKDLIMALGIMGLYALLILLLPKDITIHPEYLPEGMKIVKNTIKFLFTTFITVDYIYLLHQPDKNISLAILTLLLSLPFTYYIYIHHCKININKKAVSVMICLFIAVIPHLATVFSMMHTYSGLSFVAIYICIATDSYIHQYKHIIISFIIFVVSAMMIDAHLWNESVISGQIGKQLSLAAIKKTVTPVKKVFIINIEEEYQKLSSFCVIPYEAFGWGQGVCFENNYKWPEYIQDTIIERTPHAIINAHNIATEKLKEDNYDCIWIINHKDINVIRR